MSLASLKTQICQLPSPSDPHAQLFSLEFDFIPRLSKLDVVIQARKAWLKTTNGALCRRSKASSTASAPDAGRGARMLRGRELEQVLPAEKDSAKTLSY